MTSYSFDRPDVSEIHNAVHRAIEGKTAEAAIIALADHLVMLGMQDRDTFAAAVCKLIGSVWTGVHQDD